MAKSANSMPRLCAIHPVLNMESYYVSVENRRTIANNLPNSLTTLSSTMADDIPPSHMTARITLDKMLPVRETDVKYARQMQNILYYLEKRLRAILRKVIAKPEAERCNMVKPLYLEVVGIFICSVCNHLTSPSKQLHNMSAWDVYTFHW